MLQRPLFPKQKNVIVINDVPVKNEIENNEPFSSASNLNLLNSLKTGKVYNWSKTNTGFVGIKLSDIFSTYLDYDYYGQDSVEANYDFNKEIKKKDQIEPGEVFHKLPHQKDVWVSDRLWNQIQSLLIEIRKVEPKLIILTGKWSLFFLTGEVSLVQTAGTKKDPKPLGGLVTHRSSAMSIHSCWGEFVHDPLVVPIYHTVHANSMPDKIPVLEIDLQKLAYRYHKILEVGTGYFKVYSKDITLGTTKQIVLNSLNKILSELDEKPTLVSCDIECFFLSVIDCIGITTSKDSALVIPFCTSDNPHYWSLEDETEIMIALQKVLTHKNAQLIGQNFQFDCQFFYFNWLLNLDGTHDTMVLHHILYNYLPKDLAFLASVYCEKYQYWKDEISASAITPETRWFYNGKDIQYTLEVLENLLQVLSKEDKKLQDLYYFQQQRLSPVLVKMMKTGVRIDIEEKERLYTFFKNLMTEIEQKINSVLGFEFNQNSTPQKKALFKDFFGMELKIQKKKGTETCDASAMLDYIQEYPLYKPFLTLLLEYASLKVFVNNFLGMKLDEDGRARTQYKIAGTATGRLASTKNVRGKGANLQNIPSKGKIDLRYAVEVIEDEFETADDLVVEGTIILPNVKKIFLADKGMEIADFDLSGADAMIVAWDSECEFLIDFFSTRTEKLYIYIVQEYLQKEITTSDPFYKKAKQLIHLSNYGGMEEKAAQASGLPLHVARAFREWYFWKCPEIPKRHKRIETEIKTKGYITNIFGRRGWFLNRNDVTLLNKAYAFIPQSSVSDVINRAMVTINETLPEVQLLLNVHDSTVAQYPIIKAPFYRQKIKEAMTIELPYKRPLAIPSDGKFSTVSYGDCH